MFGSAVARHSQLPCVESHALVRGALAAAAPLRERQGGWVHESGRVRGPSRSVPGRLGARGGPCPRPESLRAREAGCTRRPCPRPESQRALSLQVIAELQGTVSSLREDSSRQQLAAERRLQEVVSKFEDEKQQLIRENERAVQVRRFRVAAGGRGSRGNWCPARLPASRALDSDVAGPARPRAHGDRHRKPSTLTADTCLRAAPCSPSAPWSHLWPARARWHHWLANAQAAPVYLSLRTTSPRPCGGLTGGHPLCGGPASGAG